MSETKSVLPAGTAEKVEEFEESMSRHEVPAWILKHLNDYKADPAGTHFWDASIGGGKPNTPTLLLTTKGRKSGRRITMPLIYGPDADRYVIVGSKGGGHEHPAWYLNLVATPEVEVQVGSDWFLATARTAFGDERLRLWHMMMEIYPPYPDYQKRTQREIPVVVLERKAGLTM